MARRLRAGLVSAALMALAAAWLLSPSLLGHGLTAMYGDGTQALERLAFVTSNDGPSPGGTLPVSWTGFLYQPRAGRAVFRIPANVRASLAIDTQLIYNTALAAPAEQRAAVDLAAGVHPVRLVVSAGEDLNRYFDAGLEWQTPVGWQLVPAVYLYPEQTAINLAQVAVDRARWAGWLAGLAVVFGIILAAIQLWARRRQIGSPVGLRLLALVLLALSLRALFLRDFTAQPRVDVLSVGADQRGYQSFALDMVRGRWPREAFYFQPGISLLIGAVYALVGPNIRVIQILQMSLGALGTLMVVDVGRRVSGGAAGWLAGLLWATFSLPIFFEAQLLTHGLEAVAGIALLWLWTGLFKRRGWALLLACGLLLGSSAVLRPTFLVLVPFLISTLVWLDRPHWVLVARRAVVLLFGVAVVIAPITLHNYRASGRFQLISGSSGVNLYLGNNRDSSGFGEYSSAYELASHLLAHSESDYIRLTWDDIRNDPSRWLQLMVRKTALYFSALEIPNNVDFGREGTAISPVLAVLPLRFGAMMALGLAGSVLILLSPARNRPGMVVVVYAGGLAAATITYIVLSRLRAPIYPALTVLGGCALAFLYRRLRNRLWRQVGVGLAALGVSFLVVAGLLDVADNVMPVPVVTALPATARPLGASLGQGLVLVGFEPLPATRPGGAALLTLYWQSSIRQTEDLHVSLQLFGAAQRKIAQTDHLLGYGRYPWYPTTRWQPGQIVRDTYLLFLPTNEPVPSALQVLAVVLDKPQTKRIGDADFGPLPLTTGRPLSVPPDAAMVGAQIGNARLAATRLETRAGGLRATLYWESGGPMAEDGIVFLHVFDSAGNFIAGRDVRPRDGLYSTRAWQPGEGIVDEHRLELPPGLLAGTYRVDVGMYDAATQVRLPVFDAAGQPVRDNVLALGSFQLP